MKKWIFYLLLLFLTIGCTNHPATNWDFRTFYKPAGNLVLKADSTFTFIDPVKNESIRWQRADVFNHAATVKGGCEDPRIVQTEDGLYVLAYTSWNYKIHS